MVSRYCALTTFYVLLYVWYMVICGMARSANRLRRHSDRQRRPAVLFRRTGQIRTVARNPDSPMRQALLIGRAAVAAFGFSRPLQVQTLPASIDTGALLPLTGPGAYSNEAGQRGIGLVQVTDGKPAVLRQIAADGLRWSPAMR